MKRIKKFHEDRSELWDYFPDMKSVEDLPSVSKEFADIIKELNIDIWFKTYDPSRKTELFYMISTKDESRRLYAFRNGTFELWAQGNIWKV